MEDFEDDKRRDPCKCGRILIWDPPEMADKDRVTCPRCGTKYKMDCDSVLVYWLEEVVAYTPPYRTEAR